MIHYVALEPFADLQDDKHVYHAGDTFPRAGFSVSDERIKELAGRDNRTGKPLIKAIDDGKEPEKPVKKRVKRNA